MIFFTTTSKESALAEVAPGDELLPGYEVVSLLRRGNRLDTYDVVSTERDCRCVVKVLRPDRQGEQACRTALVREGTLLRDLSHPHLVRAYEVITEPRTAVILETLPGDTLAAVIERGPLDPRDTSVLGLQLVSVLGYLHRQGWLHLDVKPSNIVVMSGRAVLIDLSLVSRPGQGRRHAGTDGYLAPEQAAGVGLSPASDVFGLGITLGEALTGELAHGEEGRWRRGTASRATTRLFRRRLSQVPAPMAELVEACVHPDPALRPSLEHVRSTLAVARGAL